MAEEQDEVGVATGVAYTPAGGDVLSVEVAFLRGKGNLMLTGQLGDVMKESAQAALSYVRTHAERLGIDPNFLKNHDIHVHVPAGGIPKDGPSAGVAMTSAIVSLLTGKRVRGDVAMTGEITLRGSVLPIGGLKEKVLAAHRAEIKRVILPERNRKDMVEVPDEIQDDLEFVFIGNIDELLVAAIDGWQGDGGGGKQPKKPAKKKVAAKKTGNGSGGKKERKAPARKRKPPADAPPPA
jgi:ATP-dependent Lon protease